MNKMKGAVADSMLQDNRAEPVQQSPEESKEKPDITSFAGKAGSLQGSKYGAPHNFGGVKPSMEDIKEQDTESEMAPKEQKPPVPSPQTVEEVPI